MYWAIFEPRIFWYVRICRLYHCGSWEANFHQSCLSPYSFSFFKYGGHAATLFVYFMFWGARAEDQTRGCLTAAQRATCRLCRHPVGYVATLVGYVATLVGYVATLM